MEENKIKRISLTEAVVERIQQMIEKAQMKPGDLLPTERELAEMFGVGRSSIREALGALQSAGVVEKRQGNGTFLKIHPWQMSEYFNIPKILEEFTLKELAQARRLIEEQTVVLVIQNCNPETISNLERTYNNHVLAAQTENAEYITTSDFEFHQAIAEGAHNRFLLEMLEMLRDVQLAVNYSVLNASTVSRAVLYHKQLLDAIIAQDISEARRIIHEHLSDVENSTMQIYEKSNPSDKN